MFQFAAGKMMQQKCFLSISLTERADQEDDDKVQVETIDKNDLVNWKAAQQADRFLRGQRFHWWWLSPTIGASDHREPTRASPVHLELDRRLADGHCSAITRVTSSPALNLVVAAMVSARRMISACTL